MMNSMENIELIHRYLKGECSEEEEEYLEQWLEDHPEHRHTFEYYKKAYQEEVRQTYSEQKKDVLWVSHRNIKYVPDSTKGNKGRTEAWLHFTERLRKLWKEKRAIRTARFHRRRWHHLRNRDANPDVLFWPKYLMALLVLLFGLSFAYFHFSGSFFPKKVPVLETQSSAHPIVLVLHDGSQVVLKENSLLRYPKQFFGKRQIRLEGHAVFEVVESLKTPFIVNIGTISIHALGSSFEVLTLPNGSYQIQAHKGNLIVSSSVNTQEKFIVKGGNQLLMHNDKYTIEQ
ncbi:FecR family protein [Rapidithrix thailandica]|uniref:FecR family protein n=1 Tax=Rapidithrix thailandica TaxID=413964 RepID=A0AAW9S5V5_9BACT